MIRSAISQAGHIVLMFSFYFILKRIERNLLSNVFTATYNADSITVTKTSPVRMKPSTAELLNNEVLLLCKVDTIL